MADSMTFKLNEIDSEDISDVLLKIEKSFEMNFGRADFKDCKNYGDLCDVISSHLDSYRHLNDCTSQQAFYKVRKAILATNPIPKKEITPSSNLGDIFSRSDRRKKIKKFKAALKLKVNVLAMKSWISQIILVVFSASLILFFFSWKWALNGIAISFIVNWIANKTKNELIFKTVGDLTEDVVYENYHKLRSHQGTINKYEVQRIIDNFFIQDLSVDKTELYKEASLGWG